MTLNRRCLLEKDKQNKVEEIVPITANTQEIKSLIYFVRGQQVMLDSDLAMLYQVETKVFNSYIILAHRSKMPAKNVLASLFGTILI